ncbi:MAG: hypothetical protein ACJ79D_17850 [Myxococcales bacterium]
MASGSGVVADAARAVRRNPFSVFAAAALALVPAHLVASAVEYVGAVQMDAEPAPTRAQQAADRHGELQERAPAVVSPQADAAERRDVLRQAASSQPSHPFRLRLARGVAPALALGILFCGLVFAQALLAPLAFGASSAGGACGTVGARFRPVCAAACAAGVLVAVGILCLVLPGIVVAILFLLAGPAVVCEPIGGFAALQRSVRLFGRVWPEVFALAMVAAGIDAGLQWIAFRLAPALGPVASALVDAAIGTLVLPVPLLITSVLYLHARSAADGVPVEELRQYMRRISAPG